jgi:RHS repeat-associated protein
VGNCVWVEVNFDYDAFGGVLGALGGTTCLFAGEYLDYATGMYVLRARQLSPLTGRFLTGDPFEPSLRKIFDLNKYVYARANPVSFNDPSGFISWAVAGTFVHKMVGNVFQNQYPFPIGFQNWTTISTILELSDTGFASGFRDGLLRKPDLTVAGDIREVFEIKPATRNNFAAGAAQLLTYIETMNALTFIGKKWDSGKPTTFNSSMVIPLPDGRFATVFPSVVGIIQYSISKVPQKDLSLEQAYALAEQEERSPALVSGLSLSNLSRTIGSINAAQGAALIALTVMAGLTYAYSGR